MPESGPLGLRKPISHSVSSVQKALDAAKQHADTTIRPAAELRAELDAYESNLRATALSNSLKAVVAEIDAAHKSRKCEVNSVRVIPEVAAMLVQAGYKVRPDHAAHSGDVDSHNISW